MEGLMKEKKGKADKEECMKVMRQYKDLIKRKKEESNERWIREIEEGKTMKKFCKEIGQREKVEVDKDIDREQWKGHFEE